MTQEETAYDVFVSYNHEDEDELSHASLIVAGLKARGYSVWWDRQLVLGEDWHDKLTQKMTSARKIVGLLSKRMLASEYCRYELQYALLAGKLLPVLLEPADELRFPNDLEEPIRKLNWVAFESARSDQTVETMVTALSLVPEASDALRRSAEILAQDRIHLPATLLSGSGYLAGRDTEEQLLLSAWQGCAPGAPPDEKTNIVVMHALGGAGKTSILRRMVDQLAVAEFPYAAKVLGWSAINQGGSNDLAANTDAFFSDALRTFGIVSDLPNDPVARARLLAKTMRANRTLLLLDGIEPLQEMPGVKGGRLKDPGLAQLLAELARGHPGLVVMTSRQRLPELADSAEPSVIDHRLDDLSAGASVELLEHLGCRGTPAAFRSAVELVGGHALSVTLMGTYLNVVEGGDVSRYLTFDIAKIADQDDDDVFDAQTERLASRADDIIKFYIARFDSLRENSAAKGEAETMLLRLVGLFSRPADGKAIEMLLSGDPIPGLTDAYSSWTRGQQAKRLQVAKQRLRDLRLLAPADRDDPRGFDAHPIVRAYFARQLRETRPETYRAAQTRLFHHYSNQSTHWPGTLQEMEPLLLAVQHGCRADLHQIAFKDVYWDRIQRENETYLKKVLGAYSADLGALANFFQRPWSDIAPQISDPAQQAQVFGQAAIALRITGRLDDAEDATRAAMVLERSIDKRGDVAILQTNLAELEILVGNVLDAETNARQAANDAEECFETDAAIGARSVLAESLHKQGLFAPAVNEFLEAEARQALAYPDTTYLVSQPGLRWIRCVADLGYAEDARDRAKYVATHAEQRSLADQKALGLTCVASANASLSLQAGASADLAEETQACLEMALSVLRVAECEEFLPWGALALGKAWRAFAAPSPGDWPWSLEDVRQELDVARSVALRFGLQTLLIDLRLEELAIDAIEAGTARPPTLVPVRGVFRPDSVPASEPKRKVRFLSGLFGRKKDGRMEDLPDHNGAAISPRWEPSSPWTTEAPTELLETIDQIGAEADDLHYRVVAPQIEAWREGLGTI